MGLTGNKTGPEHRRSPRELAAGIACIQVCREDGTLGSPIPACVRDISNSGLGILQSGCLRPGEQFVLRLLGDAGRLLYRVVHCRGEAWGFSTGAELVACA